MYARFLIIQFNTVMLLLIYLIYRNLFTEQTDLILFLDKHELGRFDK